MPDEKVRAWWFAPNNERRLEYGDNRLARVGTTHTIDEMPVLCQRGFHASIHPIDALMYAWSSKLYLVELSGEIVRGEDKLAAQRRTYIEYHDCDKLLRVFARRCALINIEKIKPYCSDSDYKTIVTYLTTGKNRSAAYSAACSVTWSAEEREARSTAASAAASAAFSAEGCATMSAWSSVLVFGTRSRADAQMNDILCVLLCEKFKEANKCEHSMK